MSLKTEVVETFRDRVLDRILDRIKFTVLQGKCSTFRPLRLTPFEWYMFDDGGQGSPMTFLIRLVFSGQVDREAFVTSVRRAIQRHPLLRAHVTGSRRRTLEWVPAELDDGKSHAWREVNGLIIDITPNMIAGAPSS